MGGQGPVFGKWGGGPFLGGVGSARDLGQGRTQWLAVAHGHHPSQTLVYSPFIISCHPPMSVKTCKGGVPKGLATFLRTEANHNSGVQRFPYILGSGKGSVHPPRTPGVPAWVSGLARAAGTPKLPPPIPPGLIKQWLDRESSSKIEFQPTLPGHCLRWAAGHGLCLQPMRNTYSCAHAHSRCPSPLPISHAHSAPATCTAVSQVPSASKALGAS